jgi:two-component system, chemotaxis family, sensor kinase CheA
VNPRLDIAEFLTAFLTEVGEQIVTANAQVLALEESIAKGSGNPRAVRDVFRALHTIKGLSSMVGVEPVEAIAHRMEAVLRGADRTGTLTEAALEVLVDGLRAIEQRVRALQEKRPVPEPPRELLDALDALETDSIPVIAADQATLDIADDPLVGPKLAGFEREQLARALADGRRAVRMEFVPSPQLSAAGHTINSVRQRLAGVAEIVKVVPVAVPANTGSPAGLTFVILVITSESDDALARASGLAVSSMTPIKLTTGPSKAVPAGLVPAERPSEPRPTDFEPERRSVLRVDVARVDDAMERLSSLIVSRSRLVRAIGTLAAASVDTRELTQIAGQIARQLRDLRASILHVRMVRVGEILERIPMVVRSLRRTTGKAVRLDMDTGDAELDKAVAERIFPAILHIVRNAVDHGIETPDERRAAGKPEEGAIRIATSSRSNTQLELTISDDGRGIDRARVAARAQAPVPTSDAALLELLCRPGFSTRDTVTTTSGRGVGMDIVRRVVAELGGELSLTTQPGTGTTFTLRVPLTIAIVDAFTIRCGRERFVVPVSVVEEIVDTEVARVVSAPITLPGGASQIGMFERRGEAVPLIELASMLQIQAQASGARRGMVVRCDGQPVAFVFDAVLGQQETVVRPLVDPLVNVEGISGTTDLGDGCPVLVIDLVALAAARRVRQMKQGPRVPALMGPAIERQNS